MNNLEDLTRNIEELTSELKALAGEEKQQKEGQDKLLALVRQAMEFLADSGCGSVFGMSTHEGFCVYSTGPYMLRAVATMMVSQCVTKEIIKLTEPVAEKEEGGEHNESNG